MHLVDHSSTASSTFTTQELARLAAYRAAVVAGFYTDWDGSAASTDTRLLARVLRGRRSEPAGAQPFTPSEQQHLLEMRNRVAAGAYAEDQPPPEAPQPATDGPDRPLAE